MPDPMSRPDIEDVLSSIRRLVSEEGRDSGQPRGVPSAGPGRLVLTPALRVTESAARKEEPEPIPDLAIEEVPEVAPQMAPEAIADEAPAPERAAHMSFAHFDRRPAGLASDIDPLPEDAAPVTGAGGAEDWLPETEPALRAEDLAPEGAAAMAEEGSAPADTAPMGFGAAPMFMMRPRPSSPPPAGPGEIQKTIDTLTSQVAARGEQWDPENGDEDGDENHGDAFDGPIRFFHRAPEGRMAPAATPEQDNPEQATQEQAAVVAEIPQAEAIEEVTPGELAPEEFGPEAFAPEEAAVEAEPDLHAPEEHAPEDTAAETGAGAEAAELFEDPSEDFLDEDTLREIVREVIREELQGQLGERITRNVRKLVRSEINRALASRDFE